MPKYDKYHAKWKANMAKCSKYMQIPRKMQSDHAKMLQIPCKMTGSSSKLLQIQGKWYRERKPKKNPKPEAKTRWKPRTRMYSRAWTTSENLCNRKTNLFFHASCAHIVSAKAPDQQFTKRQLTHKDTHGKHRLKTVHISPVTSLQCGVESVECEV